MELDFKNTLIDFDKIAKDLKEIEKKLLKNK